MELLATKLVHRWFQLKESQILVHPGNKPNFGSFSHLKKREKKYLIQIFKDPIIFSISFKEQNAMLFYSAI